MYHSTLLWGKQIGHGCAKEKATFILFILTLERTQGDSQHQLSAKLTRRGLLLRHSLQLSVAEEHKVSAAEDRDSFLFPQVLTREPNSVCCFHLESSC